MTGGLPPLLLRLLRDPAARPPLPPPEAHAHLLLRDHVLSRVAAALSLRGERALLVKGAALARTVYPAPWARPMRDIDLLVPPDRLSAVVDALVGAGFEAQRDASRPRSAAMLGEVQLLGEAGALSVLVEVHPTLDKIVARPIDVAALLDRAEALPGLQGLLVPAVEDHALLVVLHAAGHGFHHPIALLDLELLLRAGIPRATLVQRAREFRLVTACFVVFSALRALGAASVDDALVEAFDPGPLRRAALAPFYDVGAWPVARGEEALGLQWIAGQTPLRDDLGAWVRGLFRYGVVRVGERLRL